jgi:hypothetical protein
MNEERTGSVNDKQFFIKIIQNSLEKNQGTYTTRTEIG